MLSLAACLAFIAAVERGKAIRAKVRLTWLCGETRKRLRNDVRCAEMRFDVLPITIIFPHEPIMPLLLILLLLKENIDHPLFSKLKTALDPSHCVFAILQHRNVLLLFSR